ncbi:hypothetical protein [Streptosporangium sp. NPDC000396]|uniref:hypothetical protein n=1 Tax=Streptosporangium sp. NPDC000396 TaxID=3366185 RepID=UPI0036981A6B
MRISPKELSAACTILFANILFAPAPASAADHPSPCQSDIARAVGEQLAKAPGGTFIPPDVVAYDDGGEVITFRPPSCGPARRDTEHDCDEDGIPGNAVCLYDRRAFEGSRQAVKVTGTRKLNGTITIMSIKNDRPFVFFVKKSKYDQGTCFLSMEGYGDAGDVSGQHWVNAHPNLRECH